MKKICLLFLIFILAFPQSVFANGAGLPPFFKINNKLANPNPLQIFGITAQSFLIPQDYAPENYVVDDPIDFEVDENALQSVVEKRLLQNTKFSWDYGDGTKADGLKNTHSYTEIGSHILVLTISVYIDPNQPPTQFIDSFLINILPNKSYNDLPQAVLKVNGNHVTDPWKNLFEVNMNNPITFDATDSKSSSQIVQYLWNFGDGQTSNQKVATHKYTDTRYETVVLRVKDKNGFFSDAFVGLKHNQSLQNSTTSDQTTDPSKIPTGSILLIIVGVIIVLIVIFLWFSKKKK